MVVGECVEDWEGISNSQNTCLGKYVTVQHLSTYFNAVWSLFQADPANSVFFLLSMSVHNFHSAKDFQKNPTPSFWLFPPLSFTYRNPSISTHFPNENCVSSPDGRVVACLEGVSAIFYQHIFLIPRVLNIGCLILNFDVI